MARSRSYIRHLPIQAVKMVNLFGGGIQVARRTQREWFGDKPLAGEKLGLIVATFYVDLDDIGTEVE